MAGHLEMNGKEGNDLVEVESLNQEIGEDALAYSPLNLFLYLSSVMCLSSITSQATLYCKRPGGGNPAYHRVFLKSLQMKSPDPSFRVPSKTLINHKTYQIECVVCEISRI